MPIPNFSEQKLASRMLYAMAARTSQTVEGFSNWLAVGVGAVLSLIVSNIDKLKTYLDFSIFAWVIGIYVFTLALVFLQKWLSIAVHAAYGGSHIVENYLEKEKVDVETFNFSILSEQIERSTMWPAKRTYLRMTKRAREKAATGDIVWTARWIARRAQRQQWVVYVQGFLSFVDVCLLVLSIKWHLLAVG